MHCVLGPKFCGFHLIPILGFMSIKVRIYVHFVPSYYIEGSRGLFRCSPFFAEPLRRLVSQGISDSGSPRGHVYCGSCMTVEPLGFPGWLAGILDGCILGV